MENVVLTPHTASVSDIGNVRRRQRVGHEIAAVLQGKMPIAVVNTEVLNVVTLT
jgi:phosphoglycerate dehydrogenase-like enzyme